MAGNYVKSLTLEELINALTGYLKEHPDDYDKQVYHDCLHLDGTLRRTELRDKQIILELE